MSPPIDLAVQERIAAWEYDLKPRNHVEQFLARQAASLSIDIERDDQVIAARTAYQARVGPEIEAAELEAQAIKIGQELLVQATDEWVARHRYAQSYDRAKGKNEPPLTPAELSVHRLQSTAQGCRWLIEKWGELIEILDEKLVWGPADERRAILFLGKTPDDEDNAEIRELRLASAVMTGIKPQHIASLTEENVGRPIPSREEAQDLVKAICRRKIERLEILASVREEIFGLDPERNRLRFAFDGSVVGKELRRQQSTRRREFMKTLETLTKMQKKPVGDEPDDGLWRVEGGLGRAGGGLGRAEGVSPLSESDHQTKGQRQLKARRKQALKARTMRIITGGEAMGRPTAAAASKRERGADAPRSPKDALRSPKASPDQRPASARREANPSEGNVSVWPRGPGRPERREGP